MSPFLACDPLIWWSMPIMFNILEAWKGKNDAVYHNKNQGDGNMQENVPRNYLFAPLENLIWTAIMTLSIY